MINIPLRFDDDEYKEIGAAPILNTIVFIIYGGERNEDEEAGVSVWNPVQTVSLLYQAAQAEDAETFYAMSGGSEGYFSGQYARDMVEYTEWMKSFESVQHISIESVPRGNTAGSYREEYNERFGDTWQFIVAWDPKDEAGYQGTYWIMAPSEDGIQYVVKQTLTANLESFSK